MERVPEPELMDDPAQARAYAEADFSEPHEMFVAAFRERLGIPRGPVADLGCGPADVTIRFARAFPEVCIEAVDGAVAMLALARAAVERAGLGRRVHLLRGRIPEAPPGEGLYGTVISNSLLHHLPDPLDLWRTVRRIGAPGAAVFVMDLMRPRDEAEWERLVETYAAGAPPVLRRDFRASLAAAWRPEEVAAQLAATGLGKALRVEALSDRHLAVWGRLPGAGA